MSGDSIALWEYVINNLSFPVIMCGYLIYKNNVVEERYQESLKSLTEVIEKMKDSVDANTQLTASVRAMLDK